jgi:gluconolactonase
MTTMSDVVTLATGLDHPEGVALGPDGMLYAGGEAGQVYRIDPGDGSLEQVAAVDGGYMLGLCLDRTGAIYVCDAGHATVLRIDPGGAVDTWCDGAGGSPLVCPNWPVFAPDGSLYVSDSGPEDPAVVEGRIVRIPAGGGPAEALDLRSLHFPNGMTITPSGALVVIESFTPRISTLGEGGLELLAELPGTVPDGIAADADGGYVVSCYYPFHVYRLQPGAAPELLLHDTFGTVFPMPTNVCFFGDGLGRLAVASLGGYGISAVDIGVRGAPLFYP